MNSFPLPSTTNGGSTKPPPSKHRPGLVDMTKSNSGATASGTVTTAPACAVCRLPCAETRPLLGSGDHPGVRLCGGCYERLDQLDREHRDPAWHFATAVARNPDAARTEGVW